MKQSWLRQLRAMVRPDIRQALDGFALFFAITLFFCLLQAAHDGITKRSARSTMTAGGFRSSRISSGPDKEDKVAP